MPKTVKLTYEYISNFFKKQGCEMLDTDYKNARTHINYRCSCGNVSSIIFDSFRRGHRCTKCAGEERSKNQTLTYDYVKKYFKQFDCELLENEYIDAHKKMKYRCSCGMDACSNFNNFKRIKQCSICSLKGRSGKNHYEWKEDRAEHEEDNKYRQKCYKMLKYSLIRTGQLKSDRSYLMLGYTPNELSKHIKSHENWSKVKDGKYHIDHIFPIQAFVDYNIRDIKLINCLDNLQPLDAKENCLKNDNYNKVEFEGWLKEKKYDF